MNEADDLLDLAPAKKSEPPKRWRNWWLSLGEGVCYGCGRHMTDGEIYTCCEDYPSPDVAEACASMDEEWSRSRGWAPDKYLGAFPVGERP